MQDAVADNAPGADETGALVRRYGVRGGGQRLRRRRDGEATLRVPTRGREQADERNRVGDLGAVLDLRRRYAHDFASCATPPPRLT